MNSYSDCENKPIIEITTNIFKITLPNINYVSPKSDKKNNQSAINHLGNMQNRDEFIINYIKKNGKVTRKELENYLQISQATANRLLKKLIEKNIIINKGLGKNSWYELI